MDEVLCGKCEDPFTDPRILPCLHSFCLKCLQKLSENTNEPFQCPTCEEKVPLPEGGVQAFTKDQCKAHEAEKARLNDKIEKGEAKCDRCVRTNSNDVSRFAFNAANSSAKHVEMTIARGGRLWTTKLSRQANDWVKMMKVVC